MAAKNHTCSPTAVYARSEGSAIHPMTESATETQETDRFHLTAT